MSFMIKELRTEKNGRPCCFLTGRTDWIEIHHVFPGGNRKNSEKYGLCVFLNHHAHNEPPVGVHHNAKMMAHLQKKVQAIAMEHYGWSEEEFREIFGRSFL